MKYELANAAISHMGIIVGLFASMALCAFAMSANERYRSFTNSAAGLRAIMDHTRPKTFAAGNGTLAVLTPVSFNLATTFWQVWSNANGGTNQINTLTVDATGGNYVLGVTAPGSSIETTGNITATANAATVQAALNALGNVLPGDIVVTGGPGNAGGTTPYTLTLGGRYANTAVTIAATNVNLSGGASTSVVTTPTAATASKGLDQIHGFVWPNPITLDPDGEIVEQVGMAGIVNYHDIVLPAGQTADNLKAALRTQMRARGFTIEQLDQVH